MSEFGFAEQVNQQIGQDNCNVQAKIDEIMQEVMSDPELHSRTDWEQIQQTLGLILSSISETGELGDAAELESLVQAMMEMPEIDAELKIDQAISNSDCEVD